MGSTVGEAVSAAATAQTLHIWSLTIHDDTIGEWVNEAVTPGSNFRAPAPAHLIVYAKRDGGPLSLLTTRDASRRSPVGRMPHSRPGPTMAAGSRGWRRRTARSTTSSSRRSPRSSAMTYRHALLAVAALSGTTLAQTPQAPPAFRSSTEMVEVDVITRDSKRHGITRLKWVPGR